jgi:hypothetical protein
VHLYLIERSPFPLSPSPSVLSTPLSIPYHTIPYHTQHTFPMMAQLLPLTPTPARLDFVGALEHFGAHWEEMLSRVNLTLRHQPRP